ncbi:histone deacetylase superfamily [Gloeomargarita lithophora Alchichica-D10]|uniref:Histone deacetylase superfamily n=1 Tax=Gloeomargarita lithophora Alchichica-D10 TaxID=1188229 RepID=A0A1J0AG39_9CYAN|nr:histone deacetylase [Gloeomargarita lithophora]APB34885.1 histone deacetylase superfamily [Gloeomargarita lithophora Alchichica-D10]
MVAVIYSDAYLQHQVPYGHPERPARLTAIVNALQAVPWRQHIRWLSPHAQRPVEEYLRWVHTETYLERLGEICAQGGGHLDGDTPVSPESDRIARLALCGWMDGVDWVLAQGETGFVCARPPGHHALPDNGMGFCIFGNAAISALYALKVHNLQRVAILDWDVHHGNGTQAMVETNPHIAFCSLHQEHFYPGTGRPEERGCCNNILNLPVPAHREYSFYEQLLQTQVLPFLRTFAPQLLIISAGYDALASDPLAQMNLQPADYAQMTRMLQTLNCPLLLGLEGGYHLDSLAQAVVATLSACEFPVPN